MVFGDKVTPSIKSYELDTLGKQMFESILQVSSMEYGSGITEVLQDVDVVSSRLYSFF